MSSTAPRPLRAALFLLLGTACWGLSFLLTKTLILVQQPIDPAAGSWRLTAASLSIRFAVCAIILLAWRPAIGRITRAEWSEGVGLGFFGGIGLLFQMDGVNYTAASTAAFLTQSYCLFIPILVAVRLRRWPSRTVAVSSAMVLAGVAVLSQIDWAALRLGRGELEVLICSLFFTGQILWLERPVFSGNDRMNVSLVMFWVMLLLVAPFAGALLQPSRLAVLHAPASSVGLLVVLTLVCTLVPYLLMNIWQPGLPATHAGLIYCGEPLFASAFALFMPEVVARMAGVQYANETVGWSLVAGGGLITVANVLVILRQGREGKLPLKTG